jgi:hypothetical protein
MTFMPGINLSGIKETHVGAIVNTIKTATMAVTTLTAMRCYLGAGDKIAQCASKFFNGQFQNGCNALSTLTGADQVYNSGPVQSVLNHKIVKGAVDFVQNNSPLGNDKDIKYTRELPKAAVQLVAGVALTLVASKLFGPAPKVYDDVLGAIGLGFTPYEEVSDVYTRLSGAFTNLTSASSYARAGGMI